MRALLALVFTLAVGASAQTDTVHSAVYQGGLTVTGNQGDTVLLIAQGVGSYAARAVLRLTAQDAIAPGTTLSMTSPGSGYTSAPLVWTASVGTAATVTGTATTTTTMGITPASCPIPYDGRPCVLTYPTAPTVKTFKSGTLEVTVWSQTIAPGSIQVAACNTTCAGHYLGPLVKNEVYDLNLASSWGGISMPGQGLVSWILSPQAGSPGKVAFSATVMAYPTGTPVELAGVF